LGQRQFPEEPCQHASCSDAACCRRRWGRTIPNDEHVHVEDCSFPPSAFCAPVFLVFSSLILCCVAVVWISFPSLGLHGSCCPSFPCRALPRRAHSRLYSCPFASSPWHFFFYFLSTRKPGAFLTPFRRASKHYRIDCDCTGLFPIFISLVAPLSLSVLTRSNHVL